MIIFGNTVDGNTVCFPYSNVSASFIQHVVGGVVTHVRFSWWVTAGLKIGKFMKALKVQFRKLNNRYISA